MPFKSEFKSGIKWVCFALTLALNPTLHRHALNLRWRADTRVCGQDVGGKVLRQGVRAPSQRRNRNASVLLMKALKGRDIPAQGNALGNEPKND